MAEATTAGQPISPESLLVAAERVLRKQQWQRQQDNAHNVASKDKLDQMLLSAIEVAEEHGTDELDVLERALEAAKESSVSNPLRVRARRLLAERKSERSRIERVEGALQKLIAQAELAVETARFFSLDDLRQDSSTSSVSRSIREAERCRQDEQLFHSLAKTTAEARSLSSNTALITKAEELSTEFAGIRRQERRAERTLLAALARDDVEYLEDQLHYVKKTYEFTPRVQREADEVQGKINRIMAQKQNQQWLLHELAEASAGTEPDMLKLQQLAAQADAYGLVVPPATLALMHSNSSPRTGRPTKGRVNETHAAKVRALVERKERAAEDAVSMVEKVPGLQTLDDARRAIADAKFAKVHDDAIHDFERRLGVVERQHSDRLKAEEALRRAMRAVVPEGEDVAVHDVCRVAQLKKAVDEARHFGAREGLLHAGTSLLEQCQAFELQQRDAEDKLRIVFDRAKYAEAGMDELNRAVEMCRGCGRAAMHAEREMKRLKDEQVRREAAEAELQEASKASGPQGRVRLSAAIQVAKTEGVNLRRLRAASDRLTELETHAKKCALMAGNIRRIDLKEEPWRLQQLLDEAAVLQPWTPELEKIVRTSTQQIDKNRGEKARQSGMQAELHAVFGKVMSHHTAGQLGPSEQKKLVDVLERAKVAGVGADVLREAEEQLLELKRECSQRQVAEHRLRLAVNAKDLGEIGRCMREVKAMEKQNLLEVPPPSTAASRSAAEQSQSARLMDVASSTMRHLSDAASRKHAAELALLQHLSSEAPGASVPTEWIDAGGGGGTHGKSSKRGSAATTAGKSGGWADDVRAALREARQSGVAPSLIEHVRMRAVQKRRAQDEQEQACKALQRSLAKRDVAPHELAQNIRKVQRCQGQAKASILPAVGGALAASTGKA